jgi:hypothetical protein
VARWFCQSPQGFGWMKIRERRQAEAFREANRIARIGGG